MDSTVRARLRRDAAVLPENGERTGLAPRHFGGQHEYGQPATGSGHGRVPQERSQNQWPAAAAVRELRYSSDGYAVRARDGAAGSNRATSAILATTGPGQLGPRLSQGRDQQKFGRNVWWLRQEKETGSATTTATGS